MATADGKTPFYKKWWFWLIVVIIIIGVGGAAASSNKEPEKVGEGETTTETSKTETPTNTTFKVGDVIKSGDFEVTITSVQRDYVSANQFIEPDDGREFVLLNVEVKNVSDDKKTYLSTDWRIEDNDGALESVSLGACIADDTCLDSGDLVAGGKKTGSLIFEVPAGQEGLKVHYKPSLSFEKEAIIEI